MPNVQSVVSSIPPSSSTTTSSLLSRAIAALMTEQYSLGPPATIFFAALFLQLVLESINYLFIRRKKAYAINKAKLDATVLELDKLREEQKQCKPDDQNQKKKLEKKKKGLDIDLANQTKRVNSMKMKVGPMSAMSNILFLRTLNSKFEGVVVATLPFTPPGMFKNLSHRGVEGNDFTQMGCTGFYSLSAMIARALVQKFFELKPPRRVAEEAWEKSQKQTEALVNMFEKDSKGDGTKGEKKEKKNKVKMIGGSKKRR